MSNVDSSTVSSSGIRPTCNKVHQRLTLPRIPPLTNAGQSNRRPYPTTKTLNIRCQPHLFTSCCNTMLYSNCKTNTEKSSMLQPSKSKSLQQRENGCCHAIPYSPYENDHMSDIMHYMLLL
eukprot:5196460-Amphidinium_carterae.1